MSTEAEPTFAGGFPPATEEHWLALVDKVLKGAPRTKLTSRTADGLGIEPLYTRAGAPGGADEAGFPGAAPFTRGAPVEARPDGGWEIRSRISSSEPTDANRNALRELERGATELSIHFDDAFRSGVHPGAEGFTDLAGSNGVLIATVDDLAAVLDGVLLDLAPIHLRPGAEFTRAADMLLTLWERQQLDPASVRGGLGADPIGTLAATGRLARGIELALAEMAQLAERVASRHPMVRTVAVDTTPYVEAGAGEVQELAAMLATGAAYLRSLAAVGMDVDAACARVEVTLSVDADVFTSIAKLRAARRVWSAMTEACGAQGPARAMHLHARTAHRMLTRRDPWVNLLRVTAAGFAAGVGGADSVTTAAFDSALGEPEELGRRMARNTQLLLQEESNVGRVVDPAGGSWYVESLTDQIAVAAWSAFQELESAGGFPAALLDGQLAERLAESRRARLARVATRRDAITGVSEFADLHEAPVQRTDRDLRTLRNRVVGAAGPAVGAATGEPTEIEPLPRVRWAEQFERLRDASDAYVAATGARPRAFLVTLGPVAEHTARATFARNFYAAGGVDATTSERGATGGFDDPAQAVADALAAAPHLVCLCGSDDRYAEVAASFAAALRDAGLGPVHLAGNPGDRRDADLAAGVEEFIHIGVDVLEVLTRVHDQVGTPSGVVAQ